MFALTSALTATIWPSRVDATVMSVTTSRAWIVATAFSERSSVHLTGRPRRRERATTSISSAYTSHFDPNPPPTSGAMTRTSVSRSPSISAT